MISRHLVNLTISLLLALSVTACDLSDKPDKTASLADNGVFSANLSPNYALIGNLTGHAELWQLSPKALLHKWQHTDDSAGIIALDISANEEYVVTTEKNSIAWWRISDGVLLSVWSLPDIYSVSISPDGQFALVGLADKAIYLSLRQGKTQYAFKHDDLVTTTTLSDSGRYALTGSDDQTAKLWSLDTGELKYTWQHANKLSTVAISHQDKYVFTNATLSQTRLWKISNGKLHKELGPAKVTISAAEFSSDDRYILSGHISQRIELWKTASGKLANFWRAKKTEQWRPTAATILTLSFNDNGKKFYSLAANGILQRWKNK
jgi:WD40 repeat protein